jgi:NAD(P)-dependent dehydrogenase (short-subunit alcohol dehydrogenase family)
MSAGNQFEVPKFASENSRLAFDKSNSVQPGATFDAKKLAGRSVVITGGASGIGEATVRAFVAAGAFVTFGDIAREQAESLVSELGADKVAFVPCDVLDWSQQLQLFKTAIDKAPSKTIDVVCANAGIAVEDDVLVEQEKIAADPTADPTEPKLSTFKVNTIGVAYTAKLAGHYLASRASEEQKDRSLIITASLAGYLDMPRQVLKRALDVASSRLGAA